METQVIFAACLIAPGTSRDILISPFNKFSLQLYDLMTAANLN
jgi:hypothetical protein